MLNKTIRDNKYLLRMVPYIYLYYNYMQIYYTYQHLISLCGLVFTLEISYHKPVIPDIMIHIFHKVHVYFCLQFGTATI